VFGVCNQGLEELGRGYEGVSEGDVSGCGSTDFCLGVDESPGLVGVTLD
jgi:hypothetical protein